MKFTLLKKLLPLSIIIISALLFIPQPAHAELGDLDVVFSHDPLFTEIGIVPGDTASETISITNNTGEEKIIGIEFIGTSTNELDKEIYFEVLENGNTIFGGSADPKTLADLLGQGEISITSISPSATKLLTINADFPTSVGNPFQLKSSLFEIKVGFIYFDQNTFGIPESNINTNKEPIVLGEEIINVEPEEDEKDSITILGVELPITGATLYLLFIVITIILAVTSVLLYRRSTSGNARSNSISK